METKRLLSARRTELRLALLYSHAFCLCHTVSGLIFYSYCDFPKDCIVCRLVLCHVSSGCKLIVPDLTSRGSDDMSMVAIPYEAWWWFNKAHSIPALVQWVHPRDLIVLVRTHKTRATQDIISELLALSIYIMGWSHVESLCKDQWSGTLMLWLWWT